MQDLNDLLYFAKVVEHGGFMAAGRVLGIPKSRLSRRVAQLEQRLGVRLLQRTTRSLSLTDIGRQYYQHCQTMLKEAHEAEQMILRSSVEPRGLIKVSCPELLAKTLLAPTLPAFMAKYPLVRVQLDAINRRVDLVEEGYDIALRVRTSMEDSVNIVVRPLAKTQVVLVASPALIASMPTPHHPTDLSAWPALSINGPDWRYQWQLYDAAGVAHSVKIPQPRFITDDWIVLREAAIAGLGLAALPFMASHEALAAGQLQRVLPDFNYPRGILYAAFPSRRGLLPAARLFIDFLVNELTPIPPTKPGFGISTLTAD